MKSCFFRFWLVFCLSFFAFSASLLTGSFVQANAAAWDFDNAPTRFGPTGSLAFSELPMEGKVAHPPFSGHSWKERQGGIAYRWVSGTRAWDYTPPSAEQVKGFSEAQLRALSPAEKLDLLTGRGEFPTVFSERERNDANGLSWYGLCHGWALSAALFREPAPIVMTSPSGVSIPFGSADIKALLAYYAGEALFSKRQFVGLRCWGNTPGSPACRDMNAGAFHILLANEVGRKNRSFVVELSADEEIWNKPVLSYTSRVVERQNGASAGAAPGTKEEVTVRTSVTYVHNSEPQWEAEPNSGSTKTYSYLYRLELAEGGVVVGGHWLQDFFPDFAWTLEDRTPFASIPAGSPLVGLRELYVAATGDVCAVDASKCHAPGEPSGKFPWCPEGYTAERTPAGMEACAKGDDIFAAITPNMRDACRLSGRGAACEAAVWPRTLYFAAAGNERCPRGSEWDSTFAQCTNDVSVFGLFSQNLWSYCKVLSENDRQRCSAMQWQPDVFSRVFKEGAL